MRGRRTWFPAHHPRPLLAANKGSVDDETWAAALDAGWSDSQLLEVFTEVVRTILTNYFNHLVNTDLDLPAAPPLP
jgi:hypothetical protein